MDWARPTERAIVVEAAQLASELEASKTIRSKHELEVFPHSPHADRLISAALALAIVEIDKIPELMPASYRADLLSLLLDCFPMWGRAHLAWALQGAIQRRMKATDPGLPHNPRVRA